MGSPPPPAPPRGSSDDYSAEATLIHFQRPLPLLRGSIEASPSDDPSAGPYLLAFRSPRAWAAAYENSKSNIISQCESGARIGCSISASSKCKPPWWKTLLGISSEQDFKERARCEEIEMEACFAAAKEKCVVFAEEKCLPAFKHARVKVSSGLRLKALDSREGIELISRVCFPHWKVYEIGILGNDKFRSGYVRGSDLLDSGNMNIKDYLK
ncbi:uncharacterized protein LOC127258822 [Andrographis paniculata]|uniref:uncharacterized protein LOC127258822 n=1 Tax=Andrographis paniculata TaxID=175694 RepID=UPI0021E7B75D|nr:uncharacterized protein LOC127258822 [Andrographis paniculata]XP_051141790.1 uncharacterized protein LOC127258822 [Andrographis paniculata]XP_051141791.1 uncharacterized protein LOC127258822 [Andrographis paniculata]XP_051141792.1 uncharacterized protein LOC127258822 [Andrographis paniculata]XP_051141793.1 uncharacterized protein LOC127258822 [Andrographis paniculata]